MPLAVTVFDLVVVDHVVMKVVCVLGTALDELGVCPEPATVVFERAIVDPAGVVAGPV